MATNRLYRFFYHYNKPAKKMSVHFRNRCFIVDNIACFRSTETKWNKTQPMVVMQGFAESVKITNKTAIIQ